MELRESKSLNNTKNPGVFSRLSEAITGTSIGRVSSILLLAGTMSACSGSSGSEGESGPINSDTGVSIQGNGVGLIDIKNIEGAKLGAIALKNGVMTQTDEDALRNDINNGKYPDYLILANPEGDSSAVLAISDILDKITDLNSNSTIASSALKSGITTADGIKKVGDKYIFDADGDGIIDLDDGNRIDKASKEIVDEKGDISLSYQNVLNASVQLQGGLKGIPNNFVIVSGNNFFFDNIGISEIEGTNATCLVNKIIDGNKSILGNAEVYKNDEGKTICKGEFSGIVSGDEIVLEVSYETGDKTIVFDTKEIPVSGILVTNISGLEGNIDGEEFSISMNVNLPESISDFKLETISLLGDGSTTSDFTNTYFNKNTGEISGTIGSISSDNQTLKITFNTNGANEPLIIEKPIDYQPEVFTFKVSMDEDEELTGSLDYTDHFDNDLVTFSNSGYSIPEGIESFELSDDGSFHLTPKKDFYGEVQFGYNITDGITTLFKTLTVNISPVNDIPTIDDKSVELDEDTDIIIPLTGLDVEGISHFKISSDPFYGTAVLEGNNIRYTPDRYYNGSDDIGIIAVDSDGAESIPGIIDIIINPVNNPPTASNATITGMEGNALSTSDLDKLFGANDPDGTKLEYSIVTPPSNITMNITGDSISGTPNDLDFNGLDSAIIGISDGVHTITKHLTINIAGVNDVPEMGIQGPINIVEGESLSGSFNATDKDNDTLTYSATAPDWLGLTLNQNGEYIINPNSSGSAIIKLSVTDGNSSPIFQDVVVNVTPKLDTPPVINSIEVLNSNTYPGSSVFNIDTADIAEDGGIRIQVDAKGGGLTHSLPGLPDNSNGNFFITTEYLLENGYVMDGINTWTVTITTANGATTTVDVQVWIY